jgi:hypothetical protein
VQLGRRRARKVGRRSHATDPTQAHWKAPDCAITTLAIDAEARLRQGGLLGCPSRPGGDSLGSALAKRTAGAPQCTFVCSAKLSVTSKGFPDARPDREYQKGESRAHRPVDRNPSGRMRWRSRLSDVQPGRVSNASDAIPDRYCHACLRATTNRLVREGVRRSSRCRHRGWLALRCCRRSRRRSHLLDVDRRRKLGSPPGSARAHA